jgi:hypothetical protein
VYSKDTFFFITASLLFRHYGIVLEQVEKEEDILGKERSMRMVCP